MARKVSPQPTPAELEILGILWERGPSTCREVHDVLGERNGVGYTTTLKLLQIMVTKGLADREDGEGRSHVYRASVAEAETQQRMIKDLMDRAFGGSAAKLVMQALSANPTSQEDLEKIRAVLNRAKGGPK